LPNPSEREFLANFPLAENQKFCYPKLILSGKFPPYFQGG